MNRKPELRTFVCEVCFREYVTHTPLPDVEAETAALYPGETIPDEELASVCDDCWPGVKAFIEGARDDQKT